MKIIIGTILLLITYSGYTQNRQKPNLKLLLSATLSDSVKLIKQDTDWICSNTCIKLKIDTIDLNEVLEFQRKEHRFLYKGNIFFESQLFEMKQINDLKKISITGFSVSSSVKFEPPSIPCKQTCLTNEQIKIIVDWFTIIKNISTSEKFIALSDIQISNTLCKKPLEGYYSILNNIIIAIK